MTRTSAAASQHRSAPGRASNATPQRGPSTAIDKRSFSPLTGSDRGYSDTSEDEGVGPSNVAESSDYSPVSCADQESPEVKTESQAGLLRMAQAVQALTQHQQAT
jgi:hypothetical protein